MIDAPATLKLLIVEDDRAYASLLTSELEAMGHHVTHVGNGRDALLALDRDEFDAAVIDRMMPGHDGVALLRRLRGTERTLPIIMLTALGRPVEKIEGLDSGADDYVVKPASADEIDARLRAIMRGRAWRSKGADTIQAGDIVVSPVRFQAWRGGVPLTLARIEFRLLLEFVRAAGSTLTRSMLIELAWGYDFDPGSNVVDAQIRNLRAKLTAAGGGDLIETVRGVGYRLRV